MDYSFATKEQAVQAAAEMRRQGYAKELLISGGSYEILREGINK